MFGACVPGRLGLCRCVSSPLVVAQGLFEMSKPEFAATRYYAMAFWAPAVTVTYLPIWLNERGISDAGIGLINTLPMAGMLLFSVFVGRLADRASDWKQAIMLGTGLSAVFSLFLGFAESFWMILLVWAMAALLSWIGKPGRRCSDLAIVGASGVFIRIDPSLGHCRLSRHVLCHRLSDPLARRLGFCLAVCCCLRIAICGGRRPAALARC